MSDERLVRMMARWIGVEISRSRVRTPGKAGYGLYRVRGSVALGRLQIERGTLHAFRDSEWTVYAFALEEIQRAVVHAIGMGRPAYPGSLMLRPLAAWAPGYAALLTSADASWVRVPTRWTSAYRGRRDLGVPTAGVLAPASTARSRQRESNAAFQAEHMAARSGGLAARHAAKLARNAGKHNAGDSEPGESI